MTRLKSLTVYGSRVALVLLSALCLAAQCACGRQGQGPAPVEMSRCEAIDENSPSASGHSLVDLTLTNDSDRVVDDITVLVAPSDYEHGYGIPIRVRRVLAPHRTESATYHLSEDENLDLVDAKWEYKCFIATVNFRDGERSWSGSIH